MSELPVFNHSVTLLRVTWISGICVLWLLEIENVVYIFAKIILTVTCSGLTSSVSCTDNKHVNSIVVSSAYMLFGVPIEHSLLGHTHSKHMCSCWHKRSSWRSNWVFQAPFGLAQLVRLTQSQHSHQIWTYVRHHSLGFDFVRGLITSNSLVWMNCFFKGRHDGTVQVGRRFVELSNVNQLCW